MDAVEANGAKIPAIGLGTMTLQDAVCVEAVRTALRLGYRHIDTAERYGNEAAVGEGLRQGLQDAGLKREDVFVTTKVYQDKLAAADFKRSFDDSLAKLKLPWVDLLLIHWPNPAVPLAETLGVLCKAKREGRDQVKDGEIVTACQGACPTRAIVFGDLNDQQSQVSVTSASPRGYRMLDEINTKPRVTYLAKIRNKNPELADA